MQTRSIWKPLALAAALASAAWCQAPNPPVDQQKRPPMQQPRYRSKITVYDLAKHSASTLYEDDQQIIEAPNWSRDGQFLMVILIERAGGMLGEIVDGDLTAVA